MNIQTLNTDRKVTEITKAIATIKNVDFYDVKNLKEVNGDWTFELGKGVYAVELTKKGNAVKKVTYLWAVKTGLWD